MAAPGATDALMRQGLDRLRAREPRAALEAFAQLVAAAPNHLDARAHLGLAHLQLGETAEAEDQLRRVLAADPAHGLALRNLGVLLLERERLDDLLAVTAGVLAHDPNHRQALLLQGAAQAGLDRADDAVETFEKMLARWPDDVEALTQLGLARGTLQQHRLAMEALDRAVALRPQDPFARSRRGALRLQLQDYGGWEDYEARLDLERFISRSGGILNAGIVPHLARGLARDDLAGKRVLLMGEQGLGDQVMFASMIPDLTAAAGAVTCVCDPRLARLFTASFPNVRFALPGAPIRKADIDVVLAMGSLGRLFRTEAAQFTGEPYLTPSPVARGAWVRRLGPRAGRLRVGLSWRGGLATTRRSSRSLDLDQLAPLLDLPGCEFVSLQYGDVAAEIGERPIRAFAPAETHDLDDLAALAGAMDVVVSVQTALVHLCGAIGRDCLTLIPHNAEWRYGASGPSMPWYRSAQLLRQDKPGDWAPVIGQAVEAIRARLK